jgi:iron(III) transport system substrate-binding protein
LLKKIATATVAVAAALALTACAPQGPVTTATPTTSESEAQLLEKDSLVIYSGRSEALVKPLIELFTEETGIKVEVRYAGSAELAAQLLEEGNNSPADIFFAQDAGALGAISKAGLFASVPAESLDLVDPAYSAADGSWVGVSGRVRAFNYNPSLVTQIPSSVFELAEPSWRGKIGIAPTNASFQAFVTAMVVLEGEEKTSAWLAGMKQNSVIYEKNGAILEAVESGQVAAGLINHYYWFAKAKEVGAENMTSRLSGFASGDVGNLVNVAGAGIITDSTAARAFIEFLLSETAQRYFAIETSEYPLIQGIDVIEGLVPMSEIPAPEIDLSDLDSLDKTLELIRAAGLL